jgi:hypothetical protein
MRLLIYRADRPRRAVPRKRDHNGKGSLGRRPERPENCPDEHSTDEGLEYVAQWSSSYLPSQDVTEAVNAFMEKRKPEYAAASPLAALRSLRIPRGYAAFARLASGAHRHGKRRRTSDSEH